LEEIVIRSIFVIFIGLILITVWGCSEDGDNNPTMHSTTDTTDTTDTTGPTDTLIDISGITETGIGGEIRHNDPDDWCVPAKATNEDVLPAEFAFYPAHPNPSYQQILINYDLPVSADVNIRVIDNEKNLIRTLENGNHPAGAYVTSWDRFKEDDLEADTGLYRVIIEAGDFVCHGDLHLIGLARPSLGTLNLTAIANDSVLTIAYDSPVSVGGITFMLSYESAIGNVIYGTAAFKMAKYEFLSDKILRVVITPGITYETMAAGEHHLCTIPIDGGATLHYVDAADYIGDIMETTIVNSP
jgi:hypothetical protein